MKKFNILQLTVFKSFIFILLLCLACDKVIPLDLIRTSVGDASSNVGVTSIQINGLILDLVEPAIQHGHCYSRSPNPTINNNIVNLGGINEPGPFTSVLNNLLPETPYFIRGFMITSREVVYGEEVIISTISQQSKGPVFVTTLGISNIDSQNATAQGEISGEGFSSVIQHGHCWSTNPSPTIDLATCIRLNEANKQGSFESTLTDLSPATSYYVRAYITKDDGTTLYGVDRSFKTASE